VEKAMLESPQLGAPDEPSGASSAGKVRSFEVAADPSSAAPAVGTPLASLLASVPEASVRGDAAVVVRDVTYRSSEARPGSLFFSVAGSHADGHDFASEAAHRGAVAVVVERWLHVPCTQVLVPAVRPVMGRMSDVFFGHPSRGLSVVGVTGTNGKTTSTYLLESIFGAGELVPGVIGTTGVRIRGRTVPFDRTTPEAPDLQRLLAGMAEEGVRAVAMEVSSHGLHQHRVDGTLYRCAVFTNLSQDHLDYHGTIEEYFKAKARLFTPDLSEVGVVNADTAEGRTLLDLATVPVVTFGLDGDADVRAEGLEVRPDGLSFRVGRLHVRSRLRGRFNAYNCLGALAAARQLGIDDGAIADGIAALRGVPGRLEPVDAGQPFPVLVDYAHTPDSLDNVLRAARGLASGRVIVVFGCGGDRDRGKRPLMGEAAASLADITIVTSDNPRSEDPEAIIAEIEPGARRGGGRFALEPDRRAAIHAALAEAHEGDVVILAGKGHETGQQFRDRTIPFDDRVVAREELEALLGGGGG
jgi:UDP-N-acetylmuramoyl-L-alanyl-D-glutamate--2,6-diaminopimelate ligase